MVILNVMMLDAQNLILESPLWNVGYDEVLRAVPWEEDVYVILMTPFWRCQAIHSMKR